MKLNIRLLAVITAATAAFSMAFTPSAAAQISEEQKQKIADDIDAYLAKDYPSKVTDVAVTADKVIVRGECSGKGEFLLAEITPWQDVTEMKTFPYACKVGKQFAVTMDRQVLDREGIDYDRVFSKWAVVKVSGEAQTLDSHARYADSVAPKASPEPVPLRSKKGFAAGGSDLYFDECKDLDIGSVTMNVRLDRMITPGGKDYSYGGRSYNIGPGVAGIDRYVAKSGETDMVVSAILLCGPQSYFLDPENNGGFYTMPNLTTAEAFNNYAAVLEFMASRYCSENPGRISHWIMHNEIDEARDWTNMGSQPETRIFDRYMKSMRICYNIVRQYDQNAAILGSWTHNWTNSDFGYSPKRMMDKAIEYSNVEGDFWWGVAYHPYPQDLSSPKFWAEDTSSTYDMESAYVTFMNLEVIDAWIKQPQTLYKGTKKRVLFLSENGTNSPTYSEEDLRLQAAGGAWAWKKVSRLDGIDAIQWHAWSDNRDEFGLRLGLHTFADGDWKDYQPKPVWYVWAAAGTEKESEVFDQYLPVIGISSWDEIFHPMLLVNYASHSRIYE